MFLSTRALASQVYQGVRESQVALATALPSAERQVLPQLALKKARWPQDLKEPSQPLCWGRVRPDRESESETQQLGTQTRRAALCGLIAFAHGE